MKNIKSLLLLIILTPFGFSACQKDIVFVEGSGPGGTLPPSYTTKMSAKVDGVLVQCEFATAQEYVDIDGKKILQINGLKNPQGFTLTWQNFKGVGTYNAADLTSYGSYVSGIADPLTDSYFAESGVIKITTYNNKVIIGTFEYKAANANGVVKTITEGQFVISLAPVAGQTPGVGNTNITAMVNGTKIDFAGQANYVKSALLGNFMTIIGTNGFKSIQIVIYNFKGSGTYEIDIEAQGGYNEDQSQTGSYATESGVKTGKVIITSATATTIKGTFEFTAPNMDSSLSTKKTVTEGKFDLTYNTTTL